MQIITILCNVNHAYNGIVGINERTIVCSLSHQLYEVDCIHRTLLKSSCIYQTQNTIKTGPLRLRRFCCIIITITIEMLLAWVEFGGGGGSVKSGTPYLSVASVAWFQAALPSSLHIGGSLMLTNTSYTKKRRRRRMTGG